MDLSPDPKDLISASKNSLSNSKDLEPASKDLFSYSK